MEQGLLSSPGVSDRVLQALSQITGEPARVLRDLESSLAPPPAGQPITEQAASTRRAGAAAPAPAPVTLSGDAEEWDQVDELFRGG